MNSRFASSADSAAIATVAAPRAAQVAQTVSWALMLLGFTAAAAVLINSYLVVG
ncbi:hypothetical protein [Haliangium ochraceum]|uniref:Uncharacterized protein n=1 Tax=Haliangium ochraceum (strain DSM 14365 / JCM 11303 / SMP-2) TaxID=502025 RepID=D0LQD2_HALO1|nr:hypothetical protein [Haliangium ochraceum]ACY18941.1 hypothetical protein Hoch_6472 [Haliangium ochraceum DSM 14365]